MFTLKNFYGVNVIYIFIIVVILVGIILLILGLKKFFTNIANKYIEKNKNKLYENNREIAKANRKIGGKLLNEKSKYMKYVNELGINQRYNCSSSIVSNAENNTIKYLIKYSKIDDSEYTLERIDFCIGYMRMLNKLKMNMESLQTSISNQLPTFVRLFATTERIPYIICDVNYEIAKIKSPQFCFIYVSPAGRSKHSCNIKVTPNVLKNIQAEISSRIEKKGHSRAQRNAMTNDLREAIKKRDNYTCCRCGNSIFKEPNLLLEVDHIVPISKGGKTEASNLQTLCWRCNRQKHDKTSPSF